MTRAGALLDLAREIERKHEQAPSGRITVVPIVVDDLQESRPVLEAVAAVCHGRLFVATDPELRGSVLSGNDPIRRAAVLKAMEADAVSTRFVELLDLGNGEIDAAFADPVSGVPSPGEQTVLGVVRATMHRDFDDHELVIIAYEETLLDPIFRERLWRLAVDQLNTMNHLTVRTVVFVAQGAIDIGMHCRPGRGFQLAVDGHRLLRRHSKADLDVQVAGFVANHDPLVIFLGAGFSASSRMPLGNQLRDVAIRRILNIKSGDLLSSPTLAERFHGWVSDKGLLTDVETALGPALYAQRLTLEQVIRVEQGIYPDLPTLTEFKKHHDDVLPAPGDAVLELAAILDGAVGRVVLVEVNFDTLVERHSRARLKVFATNAEFNDAVPFLERYLAGNEPEIPLLKLHGTIDQPDSCVVSVEQTERGLGPTKVAALRSLLTPDAPRKRRWLYVGASLRDLDLRPLLRSEEFARGLDEWWVSPYLVDSVEEFGTDRLGFWKDTGRLTIEARLITEDADAFFRALRAAWMHRRDS